MKSFKQILSEENNMERLSLKSVGYKSWITPEGKAINLNNHDALYGDYHHVHKVVDNPKLFGTTTKQLKELDPIKYSYLARNNNLGYRKENWSTPILRDLGRRGYIRVANHSFEAGHDMIHDFELSNHGYEGKHHIQSFVPALRKIKDTIEKTQISKRDPIRVKLSGQDGTRERFSSHLNSLEDIDNFIKSHRVVQQTRVTDRLVVAPKQFTSTQTRKMLGRTPPEGTNIPQAIWNNMRTIGDSYVPRKPFTSYISETKEHKPLGHDFFIHTSGKLIEPRKMPLKSQFIDHVYIPMTQPEDFGMTEHQMDDLLGFSDQEKLHAYTTGRGPFETRIFHELSDRGFLKGINTKHTDEPKHTIRLEAARSSVLHRHGIESMIEPIRTLRSKIPQDHDVSLHIEGLKFHEPDDLHELHDRLSPEHIKQLTDESRIHFKNIEEVDRFLGTSTKRSRNPGKGLEPTPSPEEMRRKAGTTDEPESIQRGRFFQSDSYNPMKSFKDYISEGGIEPVKPVVPIQPELPKRKQPNPEKKPGEKETGLPEREPDKFIPTRDFPEFRPYRRSGK